ncbi:MAG: benzoyl-CoA 2,3-epoxidase subunit BoxA [Gammaproteobacteria bacterium]|jgi:benzoyl-CoA 2,3-dioxygenase component A|nr:benzoyl-CoA 2,3-epoxidase subunit BoxA [Gammaproteobacteria bacterium]MDP6165623.1 benzoyl-CoA 2,3-epoxidase subunit BoxA [Gammaproteobacteria bacterium]
MVFMRQHLIDPEVCIRCNTCEENCPIEGAIEHNDDNYVVNAALCEYCMNCIAPCPTGAINNWRNVRQPYSLEQQYLWDELPASIEWADTEGTTEALEEEANQILDVAHQGSGVVPAPATAARPQINLWSQGSPAKAIVAGNYRITEAGTESDVRHIILDFGSQSFPVLEGQSLGVIPPGVDDNGKPHAVRLYSISSPRDGERPNYNNLSLTVKRIAYGEHDETKKGLASNYMCDLQKGDEVEITGPFGSTFLMPNDAAAHIVMLCTGTGVAPFRAMTERRRRMGIVGSGKTMLFFGARSASELPYFGPLQKLSGELLDQELVYSRVGAGTKEYVQDRMLKRASDLAELLEDEDSHFFVCGLKGMETGVENSFKQICLEHNMDWDKIRTTLLAEGRYHIETY